MHTLRRRIRTSPNARRPLDGIGSRIDMAHAGYKESVADEIHEGIADAVRRAKEARLRARQTLLRVKQAKARRLAQRESSPPSVTPEAWSHRRA